MSDRIVLIETSSALCSTALAEGGKIVCERSSSAPRAHASLTAPFVKEMLDECGWGIGSLDAVCVGMGPGSYTGLRVGASTAKGLCFGAGLPLLAVDTMDILFAQAQDFMAGATGEPSSDAAGEPGQASNERKFASVIPMVDARRMEVYTCIYSANGERLSPIAPLILEEGVLDSVAAKGPMLIIGDAAQKSKAVLPAEHCFVQTYPHAKAMLRPAMRELEHKNFRDVAYFEPFYLKEFIATVSKKQLF